MKGLGQTNYLATYRSNDLEWGWFSPARKPQRTSFAGQQETIWWVLDHMKTYDAETFTHTVRPIYHKNDTNILVGALTYAVSYGILFKSWEAYGLATLEDPFVVQY